MLQLPHAVLTGSIFHPIWRTALMRRDPAHSPDLVSGRLQNLCHPVPPHFLQVTLKVPFPPHRLQSA